MLTRIWKKKTSEILIDWISSGLLCAWDGLALIWCLAYCLLCCWLFVCRLACSFCLAWGECINNRAECKSIHRGVFLFYRFESILTITTMRLFQPLHCRSTQAKQLHTLTTTAATVTTTKTYYCSICASFI